MSAGERIEKLRLALCKVQTDLALLEHRSCYLFAKNKKPEDCVCSTCLGHEALYTAAQALEEDSADVVVGLAREIAGRAELAIDSIGPVPGIAALAIGGSLFAALGGLL